MERITDMNRVRSCLPAIILSLGLLCACGKAKYADSAFTGSWISTTVSTQDADFMAAEVDGDLRIELREDGSGTVFYQGDEQGFVWTESDSGAAIEYEDKTTDALVLSGERMTLTQGDVTFVFEKEASSSAASSNSES